MSALERFNGLLAEICGELQYTDCEVQDIITAFKDYDRGNLLLILREVDDLLSNINECYQEFCDESMVSFDSVDDLQQWMMMLRSILLGML